MTSLLTRRVAFIFLALGGLAVFGVNHAMSILDIKLPLTGTWKERFRDVQKLNDYAKANPVELSNVKIENEKIDGAVIHGGLFKATDWKQVSAKKSNLTKVVFRDGVLEDVNFNDSTLTDVVFENVTLRGVRFVNTTLSNVRFIHCTLNGVNIDQTKASRIEVARSRVINTSLSDGQLIAVFRNSILVEETSLTDLQPPSSLTFEKSELDKVNLSRSVLTELVLDTVKSYRSGFDSGTVGKLRITGGDISFGLAEVKMESVEVYDVNSVGLAMPAARIQQLSVHDCREITDLNLFEATIGRIEINRCPMKGFAPAKARIDSIIVRNGGISNSEFQKMTAKSLTLENVTLDGELDFTGAQVGELKTQNVTKAPGLKLITTGSNVRF